ncbi:hypothetical protein O9993_13175 [Vibrio lentus]|nr:hypothetical protein [Vibrio lentus]
MTVSNATLHNADETFPLGCEGCDSAGLSAVPVIIPQIVAVVQDRRPESAKDIVFLMLALSVTSCRTCRRRGGSALYWRFSVSVQRKKRHTSSERR